MAAPCPGPARTADLGSDRSKAPAPSPDTENAERTDQSAQDPAASAATRIERFYRAEYPAVVRLAYALLGDLDAAEDAVQEAFATLLARFDDVANPAGYLRTCVANRCRNAWRRRRLHADRLPLARGPAPESVTAEVSELFDVLLRLPYRHRAVLVLRYYADWSEAEIAQVLGCRPGTVKSLAARGLARLEREVPR